jgi:hypothetical protein
VIPAAFFLTVLAGCSVAFFFVSPDAKRQAGVWLIAKADAEDQARRYFRWRRAELRLTLRPTQYVSSSSEGAEDEGMA